MYNQGVFACDPPKERGHLYVFPHDFDQERPLHSQKWDLQWRMPGSSSETAETTAPPSLMASPIRQSSSPSEEPCFAGF